MLRTLLITCLLGITITDAIFFGGGCCQQQSCCPPPPSCGCAQPLPPPPPPPPSCSCAPPPPIPCQPSPQQYVQSPAQSCQPRYIIVRPVEQVSQPSSYSPVAAPPAIGSYQTSGSFAPSSYSDQGPPPPPPPPPPQQPSTSYSAYDAPNDVPQPSHPPPPPPPAESYKTGGSYQNKARASKTILIDARCNSAELRQVLEDNIVADDANESKRRVHKEANEQFTTSAEENTAGIDVICAPGAFSYRISTDFFCEHAKGNITCFAYQQHSN